MLGFNEKVMVEREMSRKEMFLRGQEQKSDEVKTLVQKLKETIEEGVNNFKHHRIGFETPFVCWTIVIETALILGLFTWIII